MKIINMKDAQKIIQVSIDKAREIKDSESKILIEKVNEIFSQEDSSRLLELSDNFLKDADDDQQQ